MDDFTFICIIIIAECWLKGNDVGFDREIILTTTQ